MSIADKLTTIAENEQKVYDAGVAEGKTSGIDWDVIQNKGNRIYYPRAFGYWGYTDINPKYMIAPSGANFNNAFQGSYVRRVDWSKFDLSQCSGFGALFNSCPFIESVDIDLYPTSNSTGVWDYTFGGAQALTRIQKMVAQLKQNFKETFSRCYKLEEIRFEPTDNNTIGIGNDIGFADSPNLSRESIISICNALAMPEVQQSKTLTFSTDVDLEGKLKETILGEGGLPFAFGDGTTENIDDSGIGVYNIGNVAFEVYGTSTKDVNINILNTPIEIDALALAVFCEAGNQANYNDWLHMTIQRANGTTETVWGWHETSTLMEPGDKIISVDLTIPPGQTYYNEWCIPSLYIDYKYWAIDENENGAKWWNIVY